MNDTSNTGLLSYYEELFKRKATPGGGSAIAVTAAIAASLMSMGFSYLRDAPDADQMALLCVAYASMFHQLAIRDEEIYKDISHQTETDWTFNLAEGMLNSKINLTQIRLMCDELLFYKDLYYKKYIQYTPIESDFEAAAQLLHSVKNSTRYFNEANQNHLTSHYLTMFDNDE